MTVEQVDVVVIGSGFGGAIPAFHLASAGARVVVLERGPRLAAADFGQDLNIGGYPRMVDVIHGDGVTVLAGNCVGGSSVVYFAASLRAPGFVFGRQGSLGRRIWPAVISRAALDPWYDRVERSLPVAQVPWDQVSYAGGVFAAACDRAARTCNPVPVAADPTHCVNCNWMLTGCRFDAKRSMLLNYLPAAEAEGAQVRPLHEVQTIEPALSAGSRYRVTYRVVDGQDYRQTVSLGCLEAKVVVVAAGAVGTPVLLRRSAALLGGMPAAVGRNFSGNGDRVSVAAMAEDKVASLLGLHRTATQPYGALPIGRPITAASFDHLDGTKPEFSRFSVQQIYFPPPANALATTKSGDWFGLGKKELLRQWTSWLTLLAMTEDDNEGVFGSLPLAGSFTRLASSVGLTSLQYRPTANTRLGWALADAELRSILELDGLASVTPWTEAGGVVTAHPLGSARMGDNPADSAVDAGNELRGHPGIFVTDGAAVPTSLCVNPSLTIAALAERASPGVVDRARAMGLDIRYRGNLPT